MGCLAVGGGIMSFCKYCEECFFFCDPIIDRLIDNAEDLIRKYCARDFTKCAIFTLANSSGIHSVPGYVSPEAVHYSNPLSTKQRYSLSPIIQSPFSNQIVVTESKKGMEELAPTLGYTETRL
jgi:hypothetical protein